MQDEFDDMVDESGRMRFHTACPEGHATIQAFRPLEWRDGLMAEALTFECLYCHRRWKPTAVQRAQILAELMG